jgi:tRNA(Ile2) C34 agmatinyltransferase TiaS
MKCVYCGSQMTKKLSSAGANDYWDCNDCDRQWYEIRNDNEDEEDDE